MDYPGTYNVISICAGVGGLDLAVEIARPDAVVVCYIEREAHAAEVLAARMEDGSLSPAPIWSDLATFDPEPWRGIVDCVTSGDPCQPNSLAGRQRGKDDDRWLLDHVLLVVEGVRPHRFFRENVTGNADGQLEALVPALERLGYRVAAGIFSAEEVRFSHRRERLFVMADLAGEGPQGRIEVGGDGGKPGPALPSDRAMADATGIGGGPRLRQDEPVRYGNGAASGGGDVGGAGRGGAGQGRLDDGEVGGVPSLEGQEDGSAVHRGTGGTVGDAASDGRTEGLAKPGVRGRRRRAAGSVGDPMGDPTGGDGGSLGAGQAHHAGSGEREPRGPNGDVEDARRAERGTEAEEGHEPDRHDTRGRKASGRARKPSRQLDDTDAAGQRGGQDEVRTGGLAAGLSVGSVADADEPVILGQPHAGEQPESEREYALGWLPLGAPGPSDPRWPGILMAAPLRTPAISDLEFAKIAILAETSGVVRPLDAEETKRVLRRVDARLAYRVDRLRDCGNGVSSLAGALAWRTLEALQRAAD